MHNQQSDEKFRILIIEDDLDIRRIVLTLLAPLDFECHHAPDGVSGLQAFKESDPHLLLLDLMMPGISGLDVLRQIRETSTIPVIVLTALEEQAEGLHAFKIGADDYIVKPFDPKMLIARVIAQLRRAYRYNNSDTSHRAVGAKSSSAPSGWAACERCGYSGPHEQFEIESITGKRHLQCPQCKETEYITYSIA